MAWEWSHTPEAYANAYENIHDLPHEMLVEIMAEIKAWDGDSFSPQIDCDKFDAIIASGELADLPSDILADEIWTFAEEHRTCDNGGFNAHCCPFGCPVHTVSFDRDSDNA